MASSTKRPTPTQRRAKIKQKDAPIVRPKSKIALLVEMLNKPNGATLNDLVKKTGWQPHSVRGAISGTLKKKLGLTVSSESKHGRGRVYRITDGA